MGRSPCCSKVGMNRGAWTAMEDKILTSYIKVHGEGKWRNLPKRAGLKRCGKSCRLRWLNYLRPDIKRGNITRDEEELIVRLHKLLGNRWSLIAGRLPGRTDNEIKNYWNTTLGKKTTKTHSSENSPPPPPPPPPNQPNSSNSATKTQVIRTKATKCTKALVPLIHPPLADHYQDYSSPSIDPLEPQDDHDDDHHQNFLQEMCNYEPANFLNAAIFNNEDAKVDSGFDNIMWVGQDHSLLQECWTTDSCTDQLDSLTFLLDSEEWP
ncbi:hypothetical protein LWI28_026301 [Acer negundo]|uniref:Uncharacterized protein n=1 Tax=Acer negundo TaxID=4023 RepID=A0AAD5JHS2_ACENE|nr:hypothetical protein LWI28_026301 [Acer negundo]KAK4853956.1 hypothetical protein QYF36_016881 [Acer negundo]